MTQAEKETVQQAIRNTLKWLVSKGFTYPLEVVVTSANGGFYGARVSSDGHIDHEHMSKAPLANLPIDMKIFSANQMQHSLRIVGDCKEHQTAPEEIAEYVH